MKGPMFCIHPWQNGFDLSITGHFLEVHMSEDDETCLYCRCNVTRGQGVKAQYIMGNGIVQYVVKKSSFASGISPQLDAV